MFQAELDPEFKPWVAANAQWAHNPHGVKKHKAAWYQQRAQAFLNRNAPKPGAEPRGPERQPLGEGGVARQVSGPRRRRFAAKGGAAVAEGGDTLLGGPGLQINTLLGGGG